MKNLFLFLIFSFLVLKLHAGIAPFKFGKIEPSEFATNICPIDSNAEAYFIGDYGEARFDFASGGIVFERHYRMKIVNKNGYDYSLIKIKVYNYSSISGLKANTYNLEDGKVVKYEMDKKNKVEEKIDDYSRSINFAMPNVKEGSIIEVSYKIYYESYWLPDWYFQTSIPNLESSYTVYMPDFFMYKKLFKGYLKVDYINDSENHTYEGFSYTELIDKLKIKNVPALKDEPYVDCLDNYRACVLYELARYQFPGRLVQNFNTDYASINKTLLEADNFYRQLNNVLFLNTEIDSVKNRFPKPEDQMNAAYSFVQKQMKWNGVERMFVNESLRKRYKEHTGNASDINMMLVYMLKELGLESEPVILSTRDNGMLFPSQAMISAFNYVVAYVSLNGKEYLLDATSKYCPMGMLPPRCLNGEGRIVCGANPRWIKLNTNNNYKESKTLQLTLDSAGTLKGILKISSKDYAALDFRDSYSTYNSKDDFIKHFENSINGLKINSLKIDDLDSIQKVVSRTYELELENAVDIQGDMMYINPLLFEKLEKNPFRIEDRSYPVDYNYAMDESYVLLLTLPNGYKVEELPKPIAAAMPDNSAKFVFNINSANNSISCSRKRLINKPIYLKEDYKNIKEFYNQMLIKEGEMIVLKKI